MANLSTRCRETTFYLFVAFLAYGGAGCGKKADDGPSRVIAVTLRKGEISPTEIRARHKERVRLSVSALDVQHGFDVPTLDISEPVHPGRPAEFALDTSQKGTFRVECGILCGPRHDEMKAYVVVE